MLLRFFLSLSICGFINLAFGQPFFSTVNQEIPDNNTQVAFDLEVTGLPSVMNSSFGVETVCLNMTHTYDADMEVLLRSPDGTTVILFSSVGGDGDNFTNTCIGGTGTPIAAASAPFTGTFKGSSVMGNVNNGQNPNGTWQLLCRDMGAADIGFLQDWQINFSASPAQPFTFISSNLPIVKLTTLGDPINDGTKVEVLMQIIDNGIGNTNFANETNYAYEGKILTEWQGFSGPSYPKKNYDFDLIDNNGTKIDTSLLGLPAENDWLFKAEYLDHSLIKNTVSYEFARRMGMYAPHIRPCEIILDGNYIGYYSLTEKVKRGKNRLDIAKLTLADTSGVDLTGGYIIEMNINGDQGAWNSTFPPINNATCGYPVEFKYVYPKSSEILPVQGNYIHSFVDSFENALASTHYMDSSTGYRQFADVSSFIDFMLVNEFSVNYDSYGRSTYMYKEKNTDGGKLKIGPPWDYDRAMAYDNPSSTSGWVWEITHPYWPYPFWWSKMYTDSTYKHELACRWKNLRNDALKDEQFLTFMDSVSQHIEQAQERNFTVWADLGAQTYTQQVDSLKSFLIRRLHWMDNELNLIAAPLPQFYIPTDTTFCIGSKFDVSFNGTQYDYNWQPGPDSSLIQLETNGIYNLKVTDRYGCFATKSMQVSISNPSAQFTASNPDNGIIWLFEAQESTFNYIWNFGDGTLFDTLQQTTHVYAYIDVFQVQLEVTDEYGCVANDSLVIHVEQADIVLNPYPNPFTNSLQINHNLPLENTNAWRLYNALGQVVREGNLNNSTGNVFISAEDLGSGIYFFELELENAKSKLKKVMKI